MEKTRPKHVYEDIRTTPERLWKAITDPAFTRQYFFEQSVQSTWVAGAKYEHRAPDGTVRIEGKVVEIEPPYRLVQTFACPFKDDTRGDRPSRVTWLIEKRGDACKLTLIHDDFDGETATFKGVGDGWSTVLSGLKTLVETGLAAGGRRGLTCSRSAWRRSHSSRRARRRRGAYGRDQRGDIRGRQQHGQPHRLLATRYARHHHGTLERHRVEKRQRRGVHVVRRRADLPVANEVQQELLDVLALQLGSGAPREPLEPANAPAVDRACSGGRAPQVEGPIELVLSRHRHLSLERGARPSGAADLQGRLSLSTTPQCPQAALTGPPCASPALGRARSRVRSEGCRAAASSIAPLRRSFVARSADGRITYHFDHVHHFGTSASSE